MMDVNKSTADDDIHDSRQRPNHIDTCTESNIKPNNVDNQK